MLWKLDIRFKDYPVFGAFPKLTFERFGNANRHLHISKCPTVLPCPTVPQKRSKTRGQAHLLVSFAAREVQLGQRVGCVHSCWQSLCEVPWVESRQLLLVCKSVLFPTQDKPSSWHPGIREEGILLQSNSHRSTRSNTAGVTLGFLYPSIMTTVKEILKK